MLFFAFRITQARLMLPSVIHGLNPNAKLKAILEGCANLRYVWSPHLTDHAFFMQDFFQPNSVYIRFTHIQNLQPKFYLGSSGNGVMSREHSRFRKFLQLDNDPLVQAELSLRYWHEQNSLFTWTSLPIFLRRPDFRSLELALIQEWQPRLNYPFICQFFHPRKGLLKRPAMSLNPQFGLATLWRKRRHKITSLAVKEILGSPRFQNRLEMWKLIHDLGSNTKSRFEATKFLRSHEGGLTMSYALRRLASNIQEPFRTLSLQAIDTTMAWWKGKPAPKAAAIPRGSCCLEPAAVEPSTFQEPHTPRGRRQKSANRTQEAQGPGPPQAPMMPPFQGLPQGKGAPPPPLPPPSSTWPRYGPPVPMTMPQAVHPMASFPPQMPAMGVPGLQPAPVPPMSSATTAALPTLDSDQRELLEMAKMRQSELPADMRQKVQNMNKKEGAKATKNLHSAVKQQGLARAELEEALQARSNLISSWRSFIQDAVKTWQEYTTLFQKQELDLQERIKQAQEDFAVAAKNVEDSKEEAGKVTAVEVLDTDDEATLTGPTEAAGSSEKIKQSLLNLTESLAHLHEQAVKIEAEENEKAPKRPRTAATTANDQHMADAPDGAPLANAAPQSFA
eukprot:s2481_g10.t1